MGDILSKNMTLIGHNDLAGFGGVGEGMALQESLGIIHTEMTPNQLHETQTRMIQIGALLTNSSAMAQKSGARTLMRQHRPGIRRHMRMNPRFAIDSDYQPSCI